MTIALAAGHLPGGVTAMPVGPLPEGITLHLVLHPKAQNAVVALLGTEPVGVLSFWGGNRAWTVAGLWVAKPHRRRGLAGAMYDFVTEATGLPLEHGEYRSPNGDNFAKSHGPTPPPRRQHTNREAEEVGADTAAFYASQVQQYGSQTKRLGAKTSTQVPQGLRIEHEADWQWRHDRVVAYFGDVEVGWLAWVSVGPVEGWDDDERGKISAVEVEEPYRRQGIATALWTKAKQIEPLLHHSQALSDDGEAWSQTVAARVDDGSVWRGSARLGLAGQGRARLGRARQVTATGRADSLYGRGLDALFVPDWDTGEPPVITLCPWAQATYNIRLSGGGLYDHDAVNEGVAHPHFELVDPRDLYASQGSLTRAGVQYYLSGEWERSGKTFADDYQAGNRYPVVYVQYDGRRVILSGHHRFAAALLQGKPLRANVIESPQYRARADHPDSLVGATAARRGRAPGDDRGRGRGDDRDGAGRRLARGLLRRGADSSISGDRQEERHPASGHREASQQDLSATLPSAGPGGAWHAHESQQRLSFPSWRDRGTRPQAEALIAPDQGRSRGNSYEVFLYDEPHGHYRTLKAAQEYVEGIYGALQWERVPGDQEPHEDRVHGDTVMFNDAKRYYIVRRLPRLGSRDNQPTVAGSLLGQGHQRRAARVLAVDQQEDLARVPADAAGGAQEQGAGHQGGLPADRGSAGGSRGGQAHLRHASVLQPPALDQGLAEGQRPGHARARTATQSSAEGVGQPSVETDRRAGAGDQATPGRGRTAEGVGSGVRGQHEDHFAHRQTRALGSHLALTFETEGSPYAGRVLAYVGSEYVGSLKWASGDAGREVEMVYVAEAWRRQGIATALWQEAKKTVPDLQHSTTQYPEGTAWARTTAGANETASAAPARYFHFSSHPFRPGDLVTSPASRGQHTYQPGYFGFRPEVVYLFDERALDAMDFDPPWAPRLYEVVPQGEVEPDPEREKDRNPVSEHSWIAPSARVVAEIDVAAYLNGKGLGPKTASAAPLEHWRPHSGMFAPGQPTLDPRVFGADEQMLPQVRQSVLKHLDDYWTNLFGESWKTWARVYLAGSGASFWWDSDTDLDLLVGVDLDLLRAVRPANKEVPDEQIVEHLNKTLMALRPSMAQMVFEPGTRPFAVTYYCNADSYDIREISPYAAYWVDRNQWIVHPPVLPADWGPDSIPDATWRKVEQAVREAEQVLSLPEPDRTVAGRVLFDWVHEGRKASYSPHGGGWLDEGNVVYQALSQHPEHLLRRLYLCKHPTEATSADALEKTAGRYDQDSRRSPGHTPATPSPALPSRATPSLAVPNPAEARVAGKYDSVVRKVILGDQEFVLTFDPLRSPWWRSIQATANGAEAGYLTWGFDNKIMDIGVQKRWQRRGLATAMWRFAKEEVVPNLQHSHALTDDGKAWSQTVAKTATALTFTTQVKGSARSVEARQDGQVVGRIVVSGTGWPRPTVQGVYVDPAHRRQGIATALWHQAQSHETHPLLHSPHRTVDGDDFARALDPTLEPLTQFEPDLEMDLAKTATTKEATMTDPRVQAAVNEFLARPNLPGLTPWDAHDQCYEESQRFQKVLADHGVTGTIKMGYQREQFMGHEVITQGHVGVQVGDTVYDWTARQFDQNAPVPRIVSVQEWEAQWPDLDARTSARTAADQGEVHLVLLDKSDPQRAYQQLVEHAQEFHGGDAERGAPEGTPRQASLPALPRRAEPSHATPYPAQPNPAVGSLRQASPSTVVRTTYGEWDKALMHAIVKDRGFSFRDEVGDGPKDGFMVSVNKESEVKVPLRDITPEVVSDYLSVHQQLLKDPNNFLGGWAYKGNVYLDISRHVDDEEQAMKLAKANKQLGVFDLGTGETILTAQDPQ